MLLSLWIIFKERFMNNWPDNKQLDSSKLRAVTSHLHKAERFYSGKEIDLTIQRKVIMKMAEFFFAQVESSLPTMTVSEVEYIFITQGMGKGYLTRLPGEFIQLISKIEGSETLVEMLSDGNKLFTRIFAYTLWKEMIIKYRAAYSPYRVKFNVDKNFNPPIETSTKLSKIKGEIYPQEDSPVKEEKVVIEEPEDQSETDTSDRESTLKIKAMLNTSVYKQTVEKELAVRALRRSFETDPDATEFINAVVDVLPTRVPLNYFMLTALARGKYPLFIPHKIKARILENLSSTTKARFLNDETNIFITIFWYLVAEISKIHPITDVTDSRITEGYLLLDDGRVYNSFDFSTGYIDGTYLTSFIHRQNEATSDNEGSEDEEEAIDELEPTETDLKAVAEDLGDLLEQ